MESQPNTMQESAVEGQGLMKHAVRWGAILAGIGIVLTLLCYAIDYSLLADWKFGIVMIVLFIGLVIYGGINYRNQAGGYLSYGKAFQHGYVSLLVSGVISTLFSILLYTVIDPELPQNLSDVSIEKTEEMMRSFGAPEDAIEAQMEEVRTSMPERFSALGLIKQFGWNLIVFAVVAVITALFVKRREPEVM